MTNVREATVRRLHDHHAPTSGAARIAVALCVLLTLSGAGGVHALGLGEIVEQSALGEPLRFAIPVLINADDVSGSELAPECFSLVPGESARSGELPQIAFGRAMLERNAAGLRVIVTSNAIARDPALSFTVQAGCRLKMRHEYTVLLDPPIIHEPAAHADSEAGAPRRAAAGTSAAPNAASDASSSSARPASRAKSSAKGNGALRAMSSRAPGKATVRPKPAATTASEHSKPHLTVSRSAQDPSLGTALTDIARGESDDEIRREVEAETLVLQRRIAELSTALERMQEELREATAAREAAQRTATAAADASPSVRIGPDRWPITLLCGLAALTLAAVLIRLRRGSRPALPAFAGDDAAAADDMPAAVGMEDETAFSSHRRVSMTPAPVASPSEVDETRAADEDSFEEELLRYAEHASAYTALERQQPKVIAALIRDWGSPKVIAYLRELLVSPRSGPRQFTGEAVSDLMFLQGLAMERAGYQPDDSPWQVEIDRRRCA